MGFIASLALKLSPVGAFLKRLNLSQIALVAVLAFACVQTVRIEGFGVWPLKIHGLSDKYQSAITKLNDERSGRKADRAAYVAAQDAAAAKNKADVARIEAEQEKINAQQKSDFARDLARVRAGGVRQDLAANQRPAGSAQAGGAPQAACRDDEANLCVSRARVVQAAEIELGRNALIEWINKQLAVER